MTIPDKSKTIYAASKEYMEGLVSRAMNPIIPTGFSVIDNLVGGLQSPQVILLAGRPCAGKTALFLNLAMNIARTDSVPVAIFSPDNSDVQLLLKIYNQYGIDSTKFSDGSKLLMEDLSTISEVQDSLKEVPLYIDDTHFQTLEEIAGKITRLAKEKEVKVIFIDRMEFFDVSASLTSSERKYLAMQTLRQLADKFNITIIASERFRTINDLKPIDLKEFEEKGYSYETLKEFVDVAAVLFRPAVYGKDDRTNSAELTVLHNRNGRRDITLDLQFVPDLYSFRDIENG